MKVLNRAVAQSRRRSRLLSWSSTDHLTDALPHGHDWREAYLQQCPHDSR